MGGWVSLWNGDLGRLFYPFGTWFLGQDGMHYALIDVVVEVVVVEAVDVVQGGFFVFFRCGCLGDMMGVRITMEVVFGVVVLA